mmetsp:Transcript_88475/g.279993  ORF Transcript_88475/g.279993 Transcript_88475/m.279993 type:complete len:213 (-) Transcript_88475:100-738(-)
MRGFRCWQPPPARDRGSLGRPSPRSARSSAGNWRGLCTGSRRVWPAQGPRLWPTAAWTISLERSKANSSFGRPVEGLTSRPSSRAREVKPSPRKRSSTAATCGSCAKHRVSVTSSGKLLGRFATAQPPESSPLGRTREQFSNLNCTASTRLSFERTNCTRCGGKFSSPPRWAHARPMREQHRPGVIPFAQHGSESGGSTRQQLAKVKLPPQQ